MFKGLQIKRKGNKKTHLIAAILWFLLASFLYVDAPTKSQKISSLLYVGLSALSIFSYFYEKKPYLIIDKYDIKKNTLLSKPFNYNHTILVERTYDYVILKSKNKKPFKIDPQKIDKDSVEDFNAFISNIEKKIKNHV